MTLIEKKKHLYDKHENPTEQSDGMLCDKWRRHGVPPSAAPRKLSLCVQSQFKRHG